MREIAKFSHILSKSILTFVSKCFILSLVMENDMKEEEIERKKAELMQDIQFVDRNLMGIASLIIKEIGAFDKMKNGINLYKLDGIKIDRKNNCAQIFNLETFERQLTREENEVFDALSIKSNFINHLTSEHSRIQ